METKVAHCRKEPYDIYIGRACYGFPQSKWANPFIIGKDGNRAQVIELYRQYVLKSDLMHDLKELEGKTLGCWCKPARCHGDALIELLQLSKMKRLKQ